MKRIVFRVHYKDVSFEDLTGMECNTQDDREMQAVAERVMMIDPMVQGYHIQEDE